MFIRRSFTTFLEVHSETLAPVSATVDWTIDWRWLGELEANDILPEDTLPSEGSLINWPAWARPMTPRHA